MQPGRRLTAVLGATFLLLAGCGDGGDGGSAAASSTDPASARPSASPSPSSPGSSPSEGPTSGGSPTARPSSDGASTAQAATPARYLFPVVGEADYHRVHSLYPATDIFAHCGSPVRSPTDGVVLEVSRVDRFDKAHPRGNDKGGRSVSLLGDDGVRYYGAHLTTVAAPIVAGARLRAGDAWGTVGHTGNANNVCHLHFALSPPCARVGDWWLRRGVVYPWPYLDAWRQGTARSPAPAVRAWQSAHGCPTRPPAGQS